MEFLGIGLPELFFIVLIALIVLGPKDMIKAGRTIGVWLRNMITSPGWKTIVRTSNELRTLPNKLMREAGIDEFEKASREALQSVKKSIEEETVTIETPPGVPGAGQSVSTPFKLDENQIAPPPDPTEDKNA
jgi:Sec-independent protein translocase protein TatA